MSTVMPTLRLAQLVLLVAALAGLVALEQLSFSLVVGALVLAVLLACVDLVVLWRRPFPSLEVSDRPVGTLRRELSFTVTLSGGQGLVEVALGWPHALGGPLAPMRKFLGPLTPVTFTAVPRRRGVHQVSDIWLTMLGPLRLWARRRRHGGSWQATVLPDLRGPGDEPLGAASEGPRPGSALGLSRGGSELRALRPFCSGDDPRHVDWKATARMGMPVVRDWQPDKRRGVVLALDAGRLMRAEYGGETKFDAALRALARVALAAERRGDQVGVLVYGQRLLRYVPPLTGAGQAERLLRQVADLEPESVSSDLGVAVPRLLESSRRQLVLVITDLIDGTTGAALTQAVAELCRRHRVMVTLLRDPHLDAAMSQPLDSATACYRRVAAELVTRQRQAALQGLRARGVRAFDLSMRTIALEVVQAYVETEAPG